MTWSARCAAVWAIRRPVHDGQTPRPLHENATRKQWPQLEHSVRANPKQSKCRRGWERLDQDEPDCRQLRPERQRERWRDPVHRYLLVVVVDRLRAGDLGELEHRRHVGAGRGSGCGCGCGWLSVCRGWRSGHRVSISGGRECVKEHPRLGGKLLELAGRMAARARVRLRGFNSQVVPIHRHELWRSGQAYGCDHHAIHGYRAALTQADA